MESSECVGVREEKKPSWLEKKTGKTKNPISPFVAPPAAVPERSVARAPLPGHGSAVQRPAAAEVAHDAAAEPPEAKGAAVERVREDGVRVPAPAPAPPERDARGRDVVLDAIGVHPVERSGGELLSQPAAHLVAAEALREEQVFDGVPEEEEREQNRVAERGEQGRPEAPPRPPLVDLRLVEDGIRIRRQALDDPRTGQHPLYIVGNHDRVVSKTSKIPVCSEISTGRRGASAKSTCLLNVCV